MHREPNIYKSHLEYEWQTLVTLPDKTRILTADGGRRDLIAVDPRGMTPPEDCPFDLILLDFSGVIALKGSDAVLPLFRRVAVDEKTDKPIDADAFDALDDNTSFDVTQDSMGMMVDLASALWIADFYHMAITTPTGPYKVERLVAKRRGSAQHSGLEPAAQVAKAEDYGRRY